MNNQFFFHIIIISGRIGIVDAALVRYLEDVKKRALRLQVQVTGSIYDGVIPKAHIEEFIATLSIVDGVLKEESEVKCMTHQPNTSLIHLPEEELQQYSLKRILKKIGVGNSKTKIKINKFVTLKELVNRYGDNPHQRKMNVGLVSGSFDLIHLGHVRCIKSAKELVHVLVVATMSTNSIKKQEKNIMGDRPVYSREDRVKVLSSLRAVDYVVVFEELDCKEVMKAIRPNYFVKHEKDISRRIVKNECELVESFDGKVVLIRDDVSYSSTDIINYVRSINSEVGWHAFFNI